MTLFLPSPYQLVEKALTESTNRDAVALAKAGASDYTIVWAHEQSGGEGRLGRTWHSPKGNIYCSTILRVTKDWPSLDTLSLATGLAVARTIRKFVDDPTAVKSKWVNDVLVDDQKICGILNIGTYDDGYVVVGVGINVEVAPDLAGNTNYRATCVNRHATRPASVVEVLETFCADFHTVAEYWRLHGIDQALRQEFMTHCWHLGEEVTVTFDMLRQDGQTGINRGINDQGHLQLEQDGSIKCIYAGDVLRPRSQ